jgi:FtsX-like permease family
VVALYPADLSRFSEVRLDTTVLAFTVVASLSTGLVFGLLPGLGALRGNLGLRGAARAGGRRMRQVLGRRRNRPLARPARRSGLANPSTRRTSPPPSSNRILDRVRVLPGIEDAALCEIDNPELAAIYVPVCQMAFHGTSIIVRTAGNVAEVAASLRRAVRSVDPDQPILRVESMEQLAREQLGPWRFALTLMSGLAGVALVLAVTGDFSVISHLVMQRTHEFGVRMALGALPGDIARLVLRYGLLPALAGLALGLASAAASTQLMSEWLFGVTPLDPVTFAGVALLLAASALAAAWLPARRAARVDPLEALREQ